MKSAGAKAASKVRWVVASFIVFAMGAVVTLRAAREETGERVAYLHLTNGYWQVWVMDPDGGVAKQMTSSPVHKHAPSWCSENGVLHYYTDRGDSTFLDVDSGQMRTARPFVSVVPPPKAPDGTSLTPNIDVRRLMIERGVVADPLPSCGVDERSEILSLRVSRGLPEGMAFAVQKTIDKGGNTHFEIRAPDLNRSEQLKRTRTSATSVFTNRLVSKYGHTAFVSNETGTFELWQSDPSDSTAVQLTNLGVDVARPSWSTDGQWLYFDAPDQHGVRQLFRVRFDGSQLAQLTNGRTPSKGAVYTFGS